MAEDASLPVDDVRERRRAPPPSRRGCRSSDRRVRVRAVVHRVVALLLPQQPSAPSCRRSRDGVRVLGGRERQVVDVLDAAAPVLQAQARDRTGDPVRARGKLRVGAGIHEHAVAVGAARLPVRRRPRASCRTCWRSGRDRPCRAPAGCRRSRSPPTRTSDRSSSCTGPTAARASPRRRPRSRTSRRPGAGRCTRRCGASAPRRSPRRPPSDRPRSFPSLNAQLDVGSLSVAGALDAAAASPACGASRPRPRSRPTTRAAS